jgi:PAS domain S-box-containing protein
MTGAENQAQAEPPFQLLWEQAPDALIFADVGGAVRLWNQHAQNIFGYTASEVLGGSLDVIIPERFRSAHWRGFQRAVDSGTTKYAGRTLTTRAVHKDGRPLYVALAFSLVREPGGAMIGALAIARDCTEKYLSDKALRERITELETQNPTK